MRRTSGYAQPPLVSVLTPSIVERKAMLRECKASVKAQTMTRWEHLVEVDRERTGCSATMNRLAAQAKGTWLLPLADDDLLLPGALETLLSYARGARLVYSQPLVFGREPGPFLADPPMIPSFALIRRDLWFELGGYDESLIREEDRSLWVRAERAGVEFVKANGAPTWIYRFHGGNKSFNNGLAS